MQELRYSVYEVCESYGWDHYYCDLIKRFDAIEHGIFLVIEEVINDIGEYVSMYEQWGMLLLILIDDVFGMLDEFIDTVISPVIDMLRNYVVERIRKITSWIKTIVEYAESLYDEYIVPLVTAVNDIIDWIDETADYIYNLVVETIDATITEVYDFIVETYNTVYEYVASIIATIIDIISKSIDFVVGLIDKVWAGLAESIADVVDYIDSVITVVIDSLMEAVYAVELYLVTLIGDVSDAITLYIDAALDAIGTIFTAAFGLFAEPALPDLLALGSSGDDELEQAVLHTLRSQQAALIVGRTKRFRLTTPRINRG